MHKKAKNFSCALLMLILLLNLSSFLHTMLHIQICPEVFCTAQHDRNSTPHLENNAVTQNNSIHCPLCECQTQNNEFEYTVNFFTLSPHKQHSESFCTITCDSVKIFHNSSRAPPAV